MLTVWIESQMVNEQFSAGEMSVAEQTCQWCFSRIVKCKKKYFKKRRFSWNRLGWRFFGISASIPSKSCPVFCFFLHFLLVLSVSLAFVSYICAEIIIKCHYLNLARAMFSSVRGSVHNNDCNLLPWLKFLAIWARAIISYALWTDNEF